MKVWIVLDSCTLGDGCDIRGVFFQELDAQKFTDKNKPVNCKFFIEGWEVK